MNAGAEGKFKKGMEFYRKYTKEANAEARKLFGEVLEATEPTPTATESNRPLAARACAGLAATYRQEWNFEWNITFPAGLRDKEQQAIAWANKSVDLDPSLPDSHVQLAYLHLYKMEHDQAEKEARYAVRLGGVSFADGYAVLAQVLTHSGEPQIAVPLLEWALALEKEAQKEAPVYYLRHLGQAYYVMGQDEKYQKGDAEKAMEYYQKAEYYLKRAMEMNRDHRASRLTLAAVYMESYQEPEAQALFRDFPDMHGHITISQRRQQAPYKDRAGYTGEPSMRERYIDALRRAGYPGGTP